MDSEKDESKDKKQDEDYEDIDSTDMQARRRDTISLSASQPQNIDSLFEKYAKFSENSYTKDQLTLENLQKWCVQAMLLDHDFSDEDIKEAFEQVAEDNRIDRQGLNDFVKNLAEIADHKEDSIWLRLTSAGPPRISNVQDIMEAQKLAEEVAKQAKEDD